MKTAHDPRHLLRVTALKDLFAYTFKGNSHLSGLAQNVISQSDKIDALIKESAPTWPLDKLNKVDLVVLQIAVYELLNSKTPPKVVIDEAVELAKEYGSENSSSFVNGVLGTIYKNLNKV